MKSLIKALYLNTLDISENSFNHDREYQKVFEMRSKSIENLKKHLSDDDNELLNKISDFEAQIDLYDEIDVFKRGFYLGILLMTEVMSSKESALGES